jgi:hypothetical protein
MVAVSPFPLLPVFVELLSVPQPGLQLVPLLVKVQVAPSKLPLFWVMNAVKTTLGPRGNRCRRCFQRQFGCLGANDAILDAFD